MRLIKFRAWHIEDNFMFPVKCIDFGTMGMTTGDTAKFWVFMYFNESPSEDDPEPPDIGFPGDAVELMQYTGLHDKNGKEIYEGDKLKIDCLGEMVIVDVFFNEGLFWAGQVPLIEEYKEGEVIGNIYDGVSNETQKAP